MTEAEQKTAAKAFAEYWKGKGYEKGQSQAFWLSLLRDVYGVEHPEQYITFEEQVHLDHTSFVDGYIAATRVMIEQKGLDKSLSAPIKQSDGSLLTPFQQAKRYIVELPVDEHPRYVITCNFAEFWVYDMNKPNGEPEIIKLKDLEKEYYRLQFMVDDRSEHLRRELEVSVAAGEIVGKIYDAFHTQYADPDSVQSLHSLNVLCVRLVFCLYAENGGIFGHYAMFHDYLAKFSTHQMRKALQELFQILDTPEDKRDKYLKDDNPELAAFPYVNGGLFSDEEIEIPPFTDEIRDLLLEKASAGFNWADISPTIFGAVFESTLNPETRRSGGMHYTSVENIHKVIDPLFLDDLTAEFEEIQQTAVERTRRKKLQEFQKKLASLTFLDPACGSGNFLTETYLSLRRLENDILRELSDQITMGDVGFSPIHVSLNQFYGIEINDFAVSVAMTALWIAESQMMQETEDIVQSTIDFLPLTTNSNIVHGNALRMNWNDVVQSFKLNYIMGNPPFVGYALQSKEQKAELLSVYTDENNKPYKGAGRIDYVAGWYFKASEYMQNTSIRAAFVSTNSITQGEQVIGVWKPLYDRFNVHIDFAYRSFPWESEASSKAQVVCIIIGFSVSPNKEQKKIYIGDKCEKVDSINFYLVDAPMVFIESRNIPICKVPEMSSGGKPVEGGFLIFTDEEKKQFQQKEPKSEKYFKRFVGSRDFINGEKRWCLWLYGISPAELKEMPYVMERVNSVKEYRLSSNKVATQECAKTPWLFMEIKQPKGKFLIVPEVSSATRKYIPIGYSEEDIICSNKVRFVPDVTLYHVGMLMSNVHMAWVRAVCGRLGTGYSYSINIVYNNFPWPDPSTEQKAKIEQTAQEILDVRAKYPDCSLADLYDPNTMPVDLQMAHHKNDYAVMQAYGWGKESEPYHNESACVAELMKLYQQKVGEQSE